MFILNFLINLSGCDFNENQVVSKRGEAIKIIKAEPSLRKTIQKNCKTLITFMAFGSESSHQLVPRFPSLSSSGLDFVQTSQDTVTAEEHTSRGYLNKKALVSRAT